MVEMKAVDDTELFTKKLHDSLKLIDRNYKSISETRKYVMNQLEEQLPKISPNILLINVSSNNISLRFEKEYNLGLDEINKISEFLDMKNIHLDGSLEKGFVLYCSL